jgi:hypothetical protein
MTAVHLLRRELAGFANTQACIALGRPLAMSAPLPRHGPGSLPQMINCAAVTSFQRDENA